MRRSLIVVMGLALATPSGVAPALAQAPSEGPLGLAMDLCHAAIAEGPLTAAGDALRAAGWAVDYATNVGPSAQTIRASSRSADVDAYYQAETAAAGGTFRLRCAIDWEGMAELIDLGAFAEQFGLEGTVTPLLDGGTYGQWSVPNDEGVVLYSAISREGFLGFQMIWVEWGEPRG